MPEARHWSSCFSAGNQTLWKTLSTSAGSQTLVKLLQGRKPDAVKNPSYQCRKPDTGQVASAPETRRCEKPLVPVPEARHWSSCFSAGNQTLWKTSTSAGSQTLVKLLQRRKPDAVKNPSYQCRKPDTGQVASAPETRRCEKPLVPVPEARHWSSCFSAGNQTLWKTLSTSAGSKTLVKLLQRRKPDAVKNPSYQCRKPDTGQVASAPETRRCEKPLIPVPEARHWSSCFSAGNQTLWKTSTSAGSQTLVKLLQRRTPDAVKNP